ncbi:hypothetical protein Vadar_005027 [Vaccinium darrowii]|uniref:Uncharacterized protein n=1 Tax=Vaccinium darrowii TaxID=229202 RepID=A0ACB7Z9C5_9ERIC|nr:hypothetical protein Vadar_005027 [Vaccinium darrowii]
MVLSEPLWCTPRRKEVEDDGGTTLVYTTRKGSRVEKTAAVLRAPQKKPATKRFDIGNIPEIPKFRDTRLIRHGSPRGRHSKTPPRGGEASTRRERDRSPPKRDGHRHTRNREREDSLDRKEQEAEELAREVTRQEREIQDLKKQLQEKEKDLRSRTRSVHYEEKGRDRHHNKASTDRAASPRKRRDRSASVEKRERRKHARDRYERSGSNEHIPERHTRRGDAGRAEESPKTAREAAKEALGQISKSPLAHWIRTEKTPSRVKHSAFIPYETSTDPVAHIQHYQQAMFMHERDDALLCKMFPSSLGKVALSWYHKLPDGSILCWAQLAEEFTARFLTSRTAPKTFDALTSMRQKDDETLRQYSKRYWETFNEIENCSEEYALATFKTSLPMHSKLRESLTMHPVKTVAKLMERIQEHARVEDDILQAGGRIVAGQPQLPEKKSVESRVYKKDYTTGRKDYTQQKKDKADPDPKSYFSVMATFNIPIYKMLYRIKNEQWFRRPPKMTGNPEKRRATNQHCSYHRDWGHMTEDCVEYKKFLDEKVAEGHLKEFLADGKNDAELVEELDYEKGPKGTIHMIHGLVAPYTNNEIRHIQRVNGQAKQVMKLGTKRPRAGGDMETPITFTDDDLDGVTVPHNDALVITLRIGEYDVEKILVDQGASTEIMYYNTFKRMELPPSSLQKCLVPLVGFSAQTVWPMGKVTLPVRAGSVVLSTDFLVVDIPSSYNVIIGRTWMHKMRAVSSTYHQKIKYPGADGIECIRGDQKVADLCFNMVLRKSPRAELVQTVEVPDQPTLEDVGGDPTKKMVEGLKRVQIQEDNEERYFLIGETLPELEERDLVTFLKDHIDVFAWTPQEMPGIDPEVICHHLNVDPQHKPVVQKARRSAPQHADAVIEEVERLLEADAIREVSYPDWLANTVVVKKKNGKWRVCVDFTSLNKACPKDSFPLPRIDQLVDATSGYERMSFLDAYRGYHQIAMYEPDQEKTSFISPRGLYCYKVMPFGLRNAGATYQRLVTKMFKEQLGKTMEVYIDDMVVKSKLKPDHLADLKVTFNILRKFKLKLNASKSNHGPARPSKPKDHEGGPKANRNGSGTQSLHQQILRPLQTFLSTSEEERWIRVGSRTGTGFPGVKKLLIITTLAFYSRSWGTVDTILSGI